jgi:hypothetical protein
MPLKFHQKTIDLILQSPFLNSGNLPNLSEHNKLLLEEKEKQYQIRLPESVHEWFNLDTPSEIAHYEHGMPKIEYLQPFSETVDLDIPKPSINLWLFLMAEYVGQGWENIYFEINEIDDPPIYMDIEENWSNHKKYGPKLIRINERFSSLLHNHFWDYHKRESYPYALHLWNHPIQELSSKYYISFDKLRQKYYELPDNLQSRFHNNHVCIWAYKLSTHNNEVIFDNEFMNKGWIAADSLEKLEETLNHLWEDDIPTKNLHSNKTEVEEYLNILKSKTKKN